MMKPRVSLACWVIALAAAVVHGETIVDTDFSKGTFASLGWQAQGAWDISSYPKESAHNPGPVARFAANQPEGALTKTFAEVKNPPRLALALDYGWGWGDAGQGADAVSWMLLDAQGDGYVFEIHRTKAAWAVQWGTVARGTPAREKHWTPQEVDASHKAVRDGGGLSHVTVTREADGSWTVASKDWNQGAGGSVRFTDTTTASFSKLVLLGTQNFDEQVFNHVVLTTSGRGKQAEAVTAIPVADFLNSIGVVTTFPDRGQPMAKTVEMVRYCGFRWVRGGIEGLTKDGPTTLQTYRDLHEQTGARFSWGLVSGGTDIPKLLETARVLAKDDALLAFEGNNEPNNWGVTYQGEAGGGRAPSWLAVAKLQRDMYHAVKNDPLLGKYPVWSISEGGAEVDNVGLQFLKIPEGAGTLLPAGTQFADCANVHNYIYHPASPDPLDNKTWNAADPSSACKVDGLFGNYGLTWAKHFRGYSEDELHMLPRVTTETGCTIGGAISEETHALNLLSMYLDQYKRGWSHTAVYLLRDRTDEGGNQAFGFFKADYTPRKAAVYLHNLTTILSDRSASAQPGKLPYSLDEQPATLHDMLLQKSDGTFALLLWNERLKGSDQVVVDLGGSRAVTVYDPTAGTEPTQKTRKVDSLKLSLSDHPVVILIAPK